MKPGDRRKIFLRNVDTIIPEDPNIDVRFTLRTSKSESIPMLKHHAKIAPSLTSKLDGGECPDSCPGRFNQCIRDWVRPTAGMHVTCKKVKLHLVKGRLGPCTATITDLLCFQFLINPLTVPHFARTEGPYLWGRHNSHLVKVKLSLCLTN
jgi:hypothetical protein